MSAVFNVNMTSSEARIAYFKACEGKSKEEREEIQKKYFPVAFAIQEREINRALQGYLCGGK